MRRDPRADPDTAETNTAPDPVGFELVVFQRRADELEVTLHGMTACCDLDIVAFENTAKAQVSVTGTMAQGRLRPYQASVVVDVLPGRPVVVEGLGNVERVVGSEVPEDMPVVCGPDPMLAGLSADFLHYRDGRYVVMHASPGVVGRVA